MPAGSLVVATSGVLSLSISHGAHSLDLQAPGETSSDLWHAGPTLRRCPTYARLAAMPASQPLPDSTLSDVDLMQRIVHEDQHALMALYQRYGNQVYSLALRVLRQAPLAEEATQDTFLKVWHKSLSWDPDKGQLGSWLLTIARYTAIDHLRREQRQYVGGLDNLDRLPDPAAGQGLVGDARWQDGQLLRDLMVELPAEQAQVIELAFFHGLTHSELAEHLNLPLGTVKTRARLGLQKLRALWVESTEAPKNLGP